MKILQVITSMEMGGAEKLVVEFTKRLRQREHQVDVCVMNAKDTPLLAELEKTGCHIYRFSNGGNVYNPLHIVRLWKIMRHYDIVHTHNTSPQFFAALAAKVLCSVALVTTEHNTSNRRRDWKWYPRALDRWMYRQYDKVVCISDQAETNLRQSIGNDNCRNVCTVYNGVDVESIHDALPLNDMHPDGKTVVVMVAGFRYQKDQDTLIRSVKQLPADSYELWLVGDGERRQLLEQIADGATNIRFLGLRTDVPRLLKTADVVVMSSHFEGLSLSNIEGMSAEKPFVASDVDGLREVTKGYGLLFAHGDSEALADIIRRLHDDKSFYNEVAKRCYERARQFDISLTIEKYIKVYETVVTSEHAS